MARNMHQDRARSVKKGLVRLDRHSGTGRDGAPKKGGAGAKYTWGVPGYDDDGSEVFVDKMDPNFDEEEEETIFTSKRNVDTNK
ncbi:hypothetical protein KP509_13G010600 [Ceratopteris richardii]|uniref:Uncharacterized protein n=1 Tax=Ceratopteris richardii TaxID=49495 RepID=A0A8T2TIM9_CERRI|nr:hypothetical protein KP509_13G010600 [Ceratopteris richardii]